MEAGGNLATHVPSWRRAFSSEVGACSHVNMETVFPRLFFPLFVLTVRDNHFLSLALYGSLCAFSPAVLANKKEGVANMKIAQASSFCLLWNQ